MKKTHLMLIAAGLILQATPVLADNHSSRGGGMFDKHDSNGDGVITKAEFLESAEERFAKMDANGDGEITKEEGKDARSSMREKMKEKRSEWKEKRDSYSANE